MLIGRFDAVQMTSFWWAEIFDPSESPEEFDEQAQDWEKDWMIDADGAFLPKSAVTHRLQATNATFPSELLSAEIVARSLMTWDRGGCREAARHAAVLTGRGSTVARMKRNERGGATGSVDTEDLQATVATSLSFVRKVTLQL
eukprot:COSAG04_NODE_2806_length_3550_cov_1.782092_2_plen_142_part_01